ncbi:MAG: ABC transporter ATP-binding protein [Deltaproteobacteria bacterium]|jgi:ABC-2 type transport system ATP-binding protein|nr:ABC transporter ATP-binding protein [Deltaproteobacteria bacterium]
MPETPKDLLKDAQKPEKTPPVAPPETVPAGIFLELRSLGRSFGKLTALSGISFTLKAGEKAALVGPNGAGKSTLLKIICGAISPDTGSILLNGKAPELIRTNPRFLGWLPERAPLNPELTVLEHLKLTATFRKLTPSETQNEIERLTLGLDLTPKLDRLAGRLSLGTRRQVALAIALLGNPLFLVLDEPTSSLDPQEVRRLKKLLNDLPPETTLIVSSHILLEAYSLTQSVIILKEGTLSAKASWEDLKQSLNLETNPEHPEFPGDIYFKALECQNSV